jgi:hypothetical protein
MFGMTGVSGVADRGATGECSLDSIGNTSVRALADG